MVKTDLRHSNNTKANKNLHLEMDLWCAFVNNNKEKVLIGEAVSSGKIYNSTYKLYYFPVDYAITAPFLVVFTKGSETDSARFENVQSAKYHIKKSDYNVKWKSAKLSKQ